ncbi:MAG: tetratricopeptide repeat protein [Myxococcaceae bacterium]
MRGWLVMTALLGAPAGRAAADLNGLYKMGQSHVRVTNEGSRVRAYLEGQGRCGEEPNQLVLKAEWEGKVLVGEVTLCEVGEGCGPRSYPFLGFFQASDGSVTADLDLPTACGTPQLVDGRLVLQKAGRASAASAAALSAAPVRLGTHLQRAQKLLDRNNARGAQREFQLALEQREDAALAYLGLGAVEAKQDRWKSAVAYYEKSLEVRPNAVTYYNLSCAYARLRERRKSLDALRKSVASGFEDADSLQKDPDLALLLKVDPEFRAVLAQVKRRAETAP